MVHIEITLIYFGAKKKRKHNNNIIPSVINLSGAVYSQKSLDKLCKCIDTLQPLYNTVCYNTVLDITWFKDGSRKCIDVKM